ncbi:hypothetical protein PPUN15366_00470 [Pseudomonas putida]|nr:hypothetical protein PPUN15366_00470 [Pseudomonas putida]
MPAVEVLGPGVAPPDAWLIFSGMSWFRRTSSCSVSLAGLLICPVLQSHIALTTLLTNVSARFSKLVNRAAVTNIVP